MLRRSLLVWAGLLLVVTAMIVVSCGDDDDGGDSETATVPAAATPTGASETSTPAPEPTSGSGVHSQLITYEGRDNTSTNVYVIDGNTGTSTQLTFDAGISGHPAWATDYSRIIFSSNVDGTQKRGLYTMAPDGSDRQQLTAPTNADHWAPKYSPDMTQITFVEVTQDEGSYLVVMNADGTNQRRLTGRYRFAEFPAWTRDGALIFYAAIEEGRNSVDIYSVDPATLEVKVIVQTPASDVCPHFSRDGTILTYASAMPDEPDNVDLFARTEPFDSHTDIGDDTRLTTDPGFDDYSNPSPDDRTLVFLSRRDGNTELYLMDADGSNQRRLTNTPNLNENVPDW
jgi:TolB protein